MKINLFSDLHIEHWHACEVFPWIGEGDVLILAGDILCARHFKKNGYLKDVYNRFLSDCSKNYKKVLYVFGNHEPYQYTYDGAYKVIRENVPDNFYVLENDIVNIDGWNFIGFTFWTDFRNENPLEMMEAKCVMNDYKAIRITPNYRKLNPDDTLAFHKKSKEYLLNKMEEVKENVFVISHHSPSYQSIPQQFKNQSSAAYSSNLDEMILNHPQIKYWVHGHTHQVFDYMIGDCRVICNPGGYPGQNTGFNTNLEILI